jgi:hypothetical protein
MLILLTLLNIENETLMSIISDEVKVENDIKNNSDVDDLSLKFQSTTINSAPPPSPSLSIIQNMTSQYFTRSQAEKGIKKVQIQGSSSHEDRHVCIHNHELYHDDKMIEFEQESKDENDEIFRGTSAPKITKNSQLPLTKTNLRKYSSQRKSLSLIDAFLHTHHKENIDNFSELNEQIEL